jgi:hypothetical protein
LLSLSIIILSNLFLLIILESIYKTDWLLTADFFRSAWARSQGYYGIAWNWTKGLLGPLIGRFPIVERFL